METTPVTVTVTLLSEMLEISPRQIQMYVAQGVLPKPKVKGRYNRGDCISQFLAYKVYFGPLTFVGKYAPAASEYAFERFDYQREERAEFQAHIAKLEKRITKLEAQIKASGKS